MKINKIVIKNFRSIKSLEFYPSNVCVLVGENNAGKTNILTAINFLLGEIWPTKRSLEISDYYNQDKTQPIYIEVGFADNPINIRRIWCSIPWEGKADTKMDYARGTQSYFLSSEVRDSFALVYLDANRNLDYHLGQSRWTLFGRITRQLDEYFRNTASQDKQKALEANFAEALRLLKTDRYTEFEETFSESFSEQIKRTTHQISMSFQTFDPLNYYKTIQTLLLENGESKNPAQAGQGMRNLILLALFRTYAKVFRDNAIIAIEEPEIYLHPHAQRSLHSLFNDLAQAGNQIFYSTHSGNFVDIQNFDRICLVEKCVDEEGDTSTKIRRVSVKQLLAERQKLYPSIAFTEMGIRERYNNICGLEHNEAFFAHKVILVEGETEKGALPIFAKALGYDFDSEGVSIVNAHGKKNLDQLYQLYNSFKISIYIIFDNDRGKQDEEIFNVTLLKMLGQIESPTPDKIATSDFAILEGNFEKEMKSYLDQFEQGKYERLKNDASEELGASAGKGLVARYMAKKLTEENIIPDFIKEILIAIFKSEKTEEQEQHIESDEIPF